MLALGATSVAIATFAQFPGENLLSQTIVYTYLAVAMTYGIRFDGLEATDTVAAAAATGAPKAEHADGRDRIGANA